jgi:hypothetical protein
LTLLTSNTRTSRASPTLRPFTTMFYTRAHPLTLAVAGPQAEARRARMTLRALLDKISWTQMIIE